MLSVLAFSLHIRIISPKITQLPVTRLCPVHKNWLPGAVRKKKSVTKISCPDQHERYSIPLMPKSASLREINQEMKSEDLLTCQQLVLWHWDFAPRNILVDRTLDDNWEVTAVLDWDGVLCVPLVLAREPPVRLWQLGDQPDQGSGIDGLPIPRKLTCQEEIIKQHFEDCLKASIDIEDYLDDAYGKGCWAR